MLPPYRHYSFSPLPFSGMRENCRNRISLTYGKISVLSTLRPVNGCVHYPAERNQGGRYNRFSSYRQRICSVCSMVLQLSTLPCCHLWCDAIEYNKVTCVHLRNVMATNTLRILYTMSEGSPNTSLLPIDHPIPFTALPCPHVILLSLSMCPLYPGKIKALKSIFRSRAIQINLILGNL